MKKCLGRLFTSLLGCVLAGTMLASCANHLGDVQSSNGRTAVEYGSITVGTGSARAIDVSTLESATITVSGYGMNAITVSDVSLSAGSGSATIENIPVGVNRVVTVTSNVTGAVIRAVADIASGENTNVSVSWATTKTAAVYYNLIASGVDVSGIAASDFADAIPDVHASLFDAASFAADFKAASFSADSLTADNYILAYGTVSVTAKNVAGYTVQVTDIASAKSTIATDSETFILMAYPGTWKVWVLDASGENVATKDITVVSGETSTVVVGYNDATTFDGIQIQVAKSLNYPLIHYWSCSDSTTYANTTWPGVAMLTDWSDDDYIYNFDGASSVNLLITNSSGGKLCSSDMAITAAGSYRVTASGVESSTYIANENAVSGITLSVNSASEPMSIYVSASSAPSIWVWQPDGAACTSEMGYTWNSQPTMASATDLNYNEGWYVFTVPGDYYTEGAAFSFILNSGSTITTTKTTTFWYDAAGVCGTSCTYYDEDPTTVPEPVAPAVTIKPKDGKEVGPNDTITVTFDYGYDEENFSASVTVNGSTYTWGTDFTGTTFTKAVKDLALSTGSSVTVSAAAANSAGSDSASATLSYNAEKAADPFTWDNVNCYFVLTDRFNNGVSGNDYSYYRQNAENNSTLASDYYNVATFHGGDIAGLTAKIDYLNDLGVNAIWITAPYEQTHGWCTGGGNGFPHYSFHGYYTLDWTYMDQNVGTIEEFRMFVNACHAKGIRVVMDVVMNHAGYNTVEDMITYQFGHYDAITKAQGWCANEGDWTANPDSANDSDYWTNSYWDDSWWGCWIRSFGYESYATGGDLYSSLAGLPDIRTEMTDSVSIPAFLKTKWAAETDATQISTATGNTLGNKYGDYKLPTVEDVDWYGKTGDWRADNLGAPSDYQVIWLSAWVREFGVDGFRCDTAKHVDMYRWGQLKEACQSALEAWREDSTKSKLYNGVDTGAADWDESFWMTGECFGWTSTAGAGDYYTTGKFDSMINFSFNGSQTASTTSNYPSTSTWESYLSINSNSDSDSNGNRNNVLTYISSHDTALCRASNQAEVGTMLQLTPGGIQIFYGDECSRGQVYTDCGDSDMMTRGDMDFSSNSDCVAHWGKVGMFRKYNPAVGAGTGTAYKRTYSGEAGENSIAISLTSTTVDVSGLYDDGTTVYNWYDGTSAIVSDGTATFSTSSASTSTPVLVSDKNPADY